MFQRLGVARYKCLQRVDVTPGPFNILIGPNASGKSTLLDSLAFLHDALSSNAEQAVRQRAGSLRELVWKHANVEQGFEIAVEAPIPDSLRTTYTHLRYEVHIGLDKGALSVIGENLWLIDERQRDMVPPQTPALFPMDAAPDLLKEPLVRPLGSRTPPGYRLVIRKNSESGINYFRSERTDWNIGLRFATQRLALSGIPEDEERFPTALWFKQKLLNGIHVIQLNSVLMRRACPADAPRSFQPDGSNLPLLVRLLQQEQPERFAEWIAHLQTILKDLSEIHVVERAEDRALYLQLEYTTGLKVPAWLLSDGTLRLLALTILAYLPNAGEVYIVEEPENGVHPRALEAVFQSLNSVYDGQVFLATHSPLLLALARLEDLLVCGKTASGATDIVNGPRHPRLQAWQHEVPLETLFAAGVLE